MSLSRILKGRTAEIWDDSSLDPLWLFWFIDRNYLCSSPGLWNCELAHAGSEEVAKPRFESQPSVEYKLESNPETFLASGI